MKTLRLILMMLCLPTLASAQLLLIDYSTVQPPAAYTNQLYMSIPGVCTNAVVTIITTNQAVGDSLPGASFKLNNDLQGITNGNVRVSGVLQQMATNATFSLSGISTIIGLGPTFTSSNLSAIITSSVNPNGTINYNFAIVGGGGGSTNAIGNFYGYGTNVTLITGVYISATNMVVAGTDWLCNSNMMIMNVTNTFAIATNALIPNMNSNSCPVGTSGATTFCRASYPNTVIGGGSSRCQAWNAFTTNKQYVFYTPEWGPDDESSSPQWLTFHFTNAITASQTSFGGSLSVIALSNSIDGINWSLSFMATNGIGYNFGTSNITFPAITASYFQWTLFNFSGSDQLDCSYELQNVQLYSVTFTNPANYNLISNANALVVTAPGGVGINTTATVNQNSDGTTSTLNQSGSMNNSGGYYVNGVPIGQVSGVTNSNPSNPIGTNAPVTTFDPAATAYFAGCDVSITTNFNGYKKSTFYTTLANYYQYNPLPSGAIFTEVPTLYNPNNPNSGQITLVLAGRIYLSYTVTLYTPNINTTATVLQTPIQSLTAVNDLVLNLKATGLWNLFTNYALYPFASSYSACNGENLMGTNYPITWNGFLATSTAHGPWGVSNGIASAGYGDTGFRITNSAATNLTLVAFVESTGSPTNFLLSAYDNTNYADLIDIGGTNLWSTINTTNQGTNVFTWDTNGTFFSVTRTNISTENGLIDLTNFYGRTVLTNGPPGSNIVLFAQSAAFNESTNLVLGFAAILPGLNTNQLATLQNIVIQYEVEMGRYPASGTTFSTNTLPSVVVAGNTVSSVDGTLFVVPTINTNGTTNFDLSIAQVTNYVPADFIPIPGKVRYAVSNNWQYTITTVQTTAQFKIQP